MKLFPYSFFLFFSYPFPTFPYPFIKGKIFRLRYVSWKYFICSLIIDEADITIIFKDDIKDYLHFDKKKQCVRILQKYQPFEEFISDREPDIFDAKKIYDKVCSANNIWFKLSVCHYWYHMLLKMLGHILEKLEN